MSDPLLEILKRDAVLHGEFTLSSGRVASYYVDVARACMKRETAWMLGLEVGGMLFHADIQPGSVGGPLTGAVPILHGWMATGRLAPTFLLREAIKPYGGGGRIVGRVESPVVLVDDVTSSGDTLVEAATWLEHWEKAEILGAYVVVDRNKGAKDRLAQLGIPLLSSFTMADLGVE